MKKRLGALVLTLSALVISAACASSDAAAAPAAPCGSARHRLIGWPTRLIAVACAGAAIRS